jgi:hypothetical protein
LEISTNPAGQRREIPNRSCSSPQPTDSAIGYCRRSGVDATHATDIAYAGVHVLRLHAGVESLPLDAVFLGAEMQRLPESFGE